MAVDWLGYLFAALTATGGIIGYIKAGSGMSLVGGVIFGSLAALGSFQVSRNPKNIWLSFGTYGTLAAVMGVRFLSSWKIMPAGLMTGASLFMVLRLVLGFLWPRTKKNS
ncbi:transmembrane protein 14Cb isoform 1-T2 [Clarias gariepinus]|uniref:transmembrane protein 14Cb n=1 Tax=Clarias gariepinus TaxID=13013 RepID=UPI00234DF68C|nr:transmembrane protein 14Cb [Clarias gariepinus]XP_053350167.1 transmembrane protein 14Cb [Clarias gariepinus]